VSERQDDQIVRFYRGAGRDGAGRTIDEVWAFSAVRLELTHDFIQWLFPTRDRSRFNLGAPTLTDATVAVFRESSDLRDRLRRSLDVMLAFYGLRRDVDASGDVSIEPAPELAIRGPMWWNSGNHNHLRVTRIISSFSILGLEPEARALQACLERIRRQNDTGISDETARYWARAGTAR
jgi:Opioid growth factor receptor (OGFr) conserved region